jgi:hypothetical protein
VEIAAGGQYWTASADGSLAFYTKEGRFYQFDTNTETTTDLTPGGVVGTVEGLMGISEDGSYVYVVASGVLADGGVENHPNLYVLHDGETRYVTTLAPGSLVEGPPGGGNGIYFTGDSQDWSSVPGLRTAEVSPNGKYVLFQSANNLTSDKHAGATELYRYGAEEDQLVCASCHPSGAPPTRGGVGFPTGVGGNGLYQQRYLSNNGQVFFDSDEALVPQDTNAPTVDVYEYEEGHLYLISPGTGGPSNFADASENGENVFFTTRDQLVPQDKDQNIDMYDARVGGGFPPPSGAECTGTGCQGVPPAPPIFATPSSVTFNGTGNFPPPPPTVVKPKVKTVKCAKGKTRNKKGQCIKKKKKKAKKANKVASKSSNNRRTK